MRIIAGTAGGIPLRVPTAVARPTTDRVREAVFSMLGERVEGARVLDLFGGSGALALEALSRGAESAVIIEQNRKACEVIRENSSKARLSGPTIRQGDVFRMLPRLTERFDLIFADPPYAHTPEDPDLAHQLLQQESLPARIADGGSLILEALASKHAKTLPPGWTVLRERDYGSSRILWLQPDS